MKIEVLGTERRRRWSLQDKLQIVEETMQPGVTVTEVARRHAAWELWRGKSRNSLLTHAIGMRRRAWRVMLKSSANAFAMDWSMPTSPASGLFSSCSLTAVLSLTVRWISATPFQPAPTVNASRFVDCVQTI